MVFEFDPGKSDSNKAKHGLSLEDAKALWTVAGKEGLVRIESGEARYIRMGHLGGVLHIAIFTYRGTTIRLISARVASEKEIQAYAKAK